MFYNIVCVCFYIYKFEKLNTLYTVACVYSRDESVQRIFHVQIGRVHVFQYGVRIEDGLPLGEDRRMGRRVPERPDSQILGTYTQ